MSNIESITTTLNELIEKNREFVALLSGEWGIGKTYYWKNIFVKKHLLNKENVYISLFGQNSLKDIEDEILLKLYKSNKFIKKYKKTLDAMGKLFSKYSGLPIDISTNALLSIFTEKDFKNIVICFDDFERLSNKVSLKDVMGLISKFKEEKKAQIVMILNENELNKLSTIENEKYSDIFALYKEKIIDYNFYYNPSIKEILEVVKDDIEKIKWANSETIKNFIEELNLKNIRIIKQILYHLSYFNFIKDLKLKQKVINDFTKVAINIFRFKALSNYSYSEFLDMEYYLEPFLDPNYNPNTKREINLKHEKNKNYYKKETLYMFDNIVKVLYKWLDMYILDKEDLIDILKQKNENTEIENIKIEIDKVWYYYNENFNKSFKEISEELKKLFEKYYEKIHLSYDKYSVFKIMNKKIKENDVILDTDIEKNIIINYINLYIGDTYRYSWYGDTRYSIKKFIENIQEDYEWAEEYIKKIKNKKLEKYDKDIIISLLKDIINYRLIQNKDLTILNHFSVMDYIDIIKKYNESIELIVKFCSWDLNGANRENVIDKISKALYKISLENEENRIRVEYIAKHAKIDLSNYIKNSKQT